MTHGTRSWEACALATVKSSLTSCTIASAAASSVDQERRSSTTCRPRCRMSYPEGQRFAVAMMPCGKRCLRYEPGYPSHLEKLAKHRAHQTANCYDPAENSCKNVNVLLTLATRTVSCRGDGIES